MLNRSTGCGASTRASRCATTTIVLSSPRELISCTEPSRPTVSGRTACVNSTVSRTGRIGNDRSSGSFGSFGCMLRSERDFSGISLLECVVLKFDDVDSWKDADHAFRLTLGFYFHHRRFCTKRKDAVKCFAKGMVSMQLKFSLPDR